MSTNNKPKIIPVQGFRGNKISGSKITNCTEFDPIDSAIDKIYYKYIDVIHDKKRKEIFYHQQPVHKNFIMPITIADLKKELSKLPPHFIKGLKAIFLLSGSKKQEKVFWSNLFCYGTYWENIIFLHPFPIANMTMYYEKPPKPNIQNDYKRIGALVKRDDEKGIWIEWNEKNLKLFYLRDVFMHEIGHHYDKSHAKSEGFAEWFATEYGFKFKYYNN